MPSDRSTQSTDSLDITVSGGSVGALFTGIALDRTGHDVTVFERSSAALGGRGGGIVAQESIRRFLSRHGIADPADLPTTAGERRLNRVWYDTLTGRDRDAIFADATGNEGGFGVPPGGLRSPVERRQRERAVDILPSAFADPIAATTEPFVQAIYDPTVPAMTVDRVCLLCDAAFVPRPHTAAGTSKAAGDAAELSAALDDHGSPGDALSSWCGRRRVYGDRLVTQGRRMGDDRLGLSV
jgi:2-polyprenyl-6-methoxyphenol hydroxylase-like FAD-dependent oxidoreductase